MMPRRNPALIFVTSVLLWWAIIFVLVHYAHATITGTSFSTTVQGNGATTVFNFNFVAGDPSWVQVSYTDTGGHTTVLAPSSYTLAINPIVSPNLWGTGGTVTYLPVGGPIATGTSLTITRMEPYTQTTSLGSFGAVGTATEKALDKIVMQTQQLTAATGGGGNPNAITSLTNDVVAAGPGASPASVVRLQGRNVLNAAPGSGQVLTWVAGNNDWEPVNPAGGINTLAGDVVGFSSTSTVNTSVVRIQGRTVVATAPTNGQVYAWVTTDSAWEPFTLGTGTGTVLSVATSAPITGGTFTTVGTIGCPTCVTSAASLTANGIMTGGGGQASATSPNGTLVVGALSLGVVPGTEGSLTLAGASTGSTKIQPAANAGTNSIIRLPTGSTDFSSTGGTSQVVKQTTAGGPFTVARLACADLSDGGAGCSTGSSVSSVFGRSGTVTAQSGDYSFSLISGNPTPAQLGASPLNHATLIDVAGVVNWRLWPDCQDTLGQHINYTQSSDSISCGTSSSGGGGGAINITDGTHTVNGATNLTVGNSLLVGGSTPNATLNSTVFVTERSTSCTVASNSAGCTGNTGGDMGLAVSLTGSGATITLPAASSTIFAPGMTLDISTAGATGNWTLVNSTGLTLSGLNSTTLIPGTAGTLVANNDGAHLDFFPSLQSPSTTVLGGVLSSSAPSNQFANGVSTGGAVTYAQPTVGNLAAISNNTFVANISGVTASPAPSGPSAVLDSMFGSTQGMIIYRDVLVWKALIPPVTAGTYELQIVGGTGHNPYWQNIVLTPCTNNLIMDFSATCDAVSYMIGVN